MRNILIVCLVLLLGSSLFIYSKSQQGVAENPTRTTGQASIGGAFTLVDQDGKAVTEKDYRGKYMLVFFGFTNCPDVCLIAAHTMGGAMKKITDEQRSKLNMIFVTLDPERDTPEAMKKWLEDYDTRIIGLTGTPENVKAARAAYKVYSKKVQQEGDPNYRIDHSSYMYLMDPEGTYITHFPHNVALDKLMEALGANIQ